MLKVFDLCNKKKIVSKNVIIKSILLTVYSDFRQNINQYLQYI